MSATDGRPTPRPPFRPRPVTLRSALVTLAPLSPEHAGPLFEVGQDAELWQHMPSAAFSRPEQAEAWVALALGEQAAGRALPFVTIEAASGRVVGSTRFLDLRLADRALEIGYTWLGRAWLRSAVNTECKWLLLRHAFETLGAVRVQLKTDARNLRSQAAIERLGARREGVLRKHMLVQHGVHRDSVYYSIVDDEWQQVRARLQALRARGA